MYSSHVSVLLQYKMLNLTAFLLGKGPNEKKDSVTIEPTHQIVDPLEQGLQLIVRIGVQLTKKKISPLCIHVPINNGPEKFNA